MSPQELKASILQLKAVTIVSRKGARCNETELQWKMCPRTCALAEVLWTGSRRPGHADFASRMKIHRKRLLAAKVNCATIE